MNAGRAVALLMSIDGSSVRHSGVTPRLRERRSPKPALTSLAAADAVTAPAVAPTVGPRRRSWFGRAVEPSSPA